MDRLLFSSMLRERTVWDLLQKSFSICQGIEITETTNVDFDLCLENNVSKRKVVAKLIDPSFIIYNQDSTVNDWASRITPEPDVVLILPTDDPGQQALALQMLQLYLLDLQVAVTVLLVPHIDQVLPILATYTNVNDGSGPPIRRETLPTEIIPYATSSAPRIMLSDKEAQTVYQICGSIAGLELYTRSRKGQNKLSEFLAQDLVNSMVEFWKDEWIV